MAEAQAKYDKAVEIILTALKVRKIKTENALIFYGNRGIIEIEVNKNEIFDFIM